MDVQTGEELDMDIIKVQVTPTYCQCYEPQYLSITEGRVIGCGNSRGLSFYLGYCSKEEFEERVKPIREAMEKYNYIVRTLWEKPGFKEFFAEHNSVLSKKEMNEQFGNEVTDLAFSLQSPQGCYPDLVVQRELFQLDGAGYEAKFLFKGKEYSFDLSAGTDGFPEEIDGKICFWNTDQNNTDYALYFAKSIEKLERSSKNNLVYTDWLDQFDYYDQWRGENLPIVEAINEVFTLMEQGGCLTKYLLKADTCLSIWDYYTGGTVGLYMFNPKAYTDKVFVSSLSIHPQALFLSNL